MKQKTDRFDNPLTTCKLCGAGNIAAYHCDHKGRRISICSDCGIQFLNPQFTDKYLAAYYSSYYTSEKPEWDEPLLYGHDFYLSLIEREIPPGRLLDIGCGRGHLLSAAQNRGWDVVGQEIDPDLAADTSKKTGIEVHCGSLQDHPFAKRTFDAVSMHQVIEHVKDPVAYWREIHSLLKSNGIFFLVLPNIRSRSSIFKLFLEKRGLKRKNVGSYYDTDHHLWYFSPAVLSASLARFGFKVVYMRSGHAVRPRQTKIKRFIMRNFTEKPLWKSTFLAIAKKIS